jgi:hypothetical protein
MRPGFITAEFFELAGKAERDHAEEARLGEMKTQLAQRILAVPAEDVHEIGLNIRDFGFRSGLIGAQRDLISVK